MLLTVKYTVVAATTTTTTTASASGITTTIKTITSASKQDFQQLFCYGLICTRESKNKKKKSQ